MAMEEMRSKHIISLALLMLFALSFIIIYNNTSRTDIFAVESQMSNQTTNLSSPNNTQTSNPCIDNPNGFSVTPPSNWITWHGCTFFSPAPDQTFPDLSQGDTFVRITRSNLTMPVLSSYQ